MQITIFTDRIWPTAIKTCIAHDITEQYHAITFSRWVNKLDIVMQRIVMQRARHVIFVYLYLLVKSMTVLSTYHTCSFNRDCDRTAPNIINYTIELYRSRHVFTTIRDWLMYDGWPPGKTGRCESAFMGSLVGAYFNMRPTDCMKTLSCRHGHNINQTSSFFFFHLAPRRWSCTLRCLQHGSNQTKSMYWYTCTELTASTVITGAAGVRRRHHSRTGFLWPNYRRRTPLIKIFRVEIFIKVKS